MASAASTSFSSASKYSFEVFLSFRGADTRKSFTDHLYLALVNAGFHTFLDDDSIPRGENIHPEILSAIKSSKVAVIIFSKNFASSESGLDKVAQIMDCTSSRGLVAIPVFYHVDPSDVRKQSGRYGEAFAAHEKKFEPERVQKWREALERVANMEGMVLGDRHESMFIRDIVAELTTIVHRRVVYLSPYLVGTESQVEKVSSWLQDESTHIQTMIIYGSVGIGKTTIAKIVYNRNRESFEGSSFLENISRTVSEEPHGLLTLLRVLLSDILTMRSHKIRREDEGILELRRAMAYGKVLIVLDDVSRLTFLTEMRKWLSPRSKLIVTTRDAGLLGAQEDCKMLRVGELNDFQSLQILSLYAFGQDHPRKGYEYQIKRAVNYCGGLPLALEVLGSFLRGRCVDVWESMLQKMVEIPHPVIDAVLRTSFDSLEAYDKSLFLDIACFLIGMDKDYAFTITDSCGCESRIGMQTLVDRCLITIEETNKIRMHPLVRDMGRGIIRRESHDPGNRSRLWHHQDAYFVLKEDRGTKKIKGLSLNLLDVRTFSKVDHGKRGSIDNPELLNKQHWGKRYRSGLLSWLPGYGGPSNYFPTSDEEILRTEAFAKMTRLKLLLLNNVKLEGSLGDLPKDLVWLNWNRFHMDCIPVGFPPENLVVLEMLNSRLKIVWKGTRWLPKLKILNLSHSLDLVSTPDLSGLPLLERLVLDGCKKLVTIHESIGGLRKIALLNLRDCKSLQKIPGAIGELESLEEVIVSGCSQLHLPPELLREMKSRVVVADGLAVDQLQSPYATARKPSLLPPNSSLTFLPRSFVCFSLANCKTLGNCNLSYDCIAVSLRFLRPLHHDDPSFGRIPPVPEGKCRLSFHVPGLGKLQHLEQSTCMERELDPAAHFSRKVVFNCHFCENLVEIGGLFKLQCMRNVDKEIIRGLGMVKLEFLASTPVVLANSLTRTSRAIQPQVLHESGIFTFFLSGSEIPDWYSYEVEGSSFSFDVPHVLDKKLIGFNICVVYALQGMLDSVKEDRFDFPHVCIQIMNKRLSWIYRPTFFEIPEECEDKQWFSHLSIGNHLDTGDEVRISVMPYGYWVKRFGIHLVCEKGEDSQSISTSAWYKNLSDQGQSSFHHLWLSEKS